MENDKVQMGLAQCAREKYWSEKTADERVQTLAQELAGALVTIYQLQEKLSKLEAHSHGLNGSMLVPYLENGGLNQINTDTYKRADWIYQKLGLRDPR